MSQNIEFLTSKIKDLQSKLSIQSQRIQHLQTQNQQLMAIVVQASHHNVQKTNQFICKVQRLVMNKFETSSTKDTRKSKDQKQYRMKNKDGSKGYYKDQEMRMKTQYSGRKTEEGGRDGRERRERREKQKQGYLMMENRERDIGRGKQNESINRSKIYDKMNKKELISEMQSTRRIQKRII